MKAGEIAVPLEPGNEMPVVRHQAIGTQSHPASTERFLDNPLEREEILVLVKERPPPHAPV